MRRAVLCTCLAIASSGSGAEGIRVVNEGGIRDAWTLRPGFSLPVPAYPREYSAQPGEVCVAIGYLIHGDGTTSDFALIKSWTAAEVAKADEQNYWGAFANAAAQALAQWQFQPRPEVKSPKPVFTVATFVFGSRDPMELRKRCAVPDLATLLRTLRQEQPRRRMTNTAVWDQLELAPLRRDGNPAGIRY